MTDDEHKRILAAGVEFFTAAKPILEKYGLSDEHVPSLVLMAIGAVLRTTDVTPETLVAGGHQTQRYWQFDPSSELPCRARFEDPSNDPGSSN